MGRYYQLTKSITEEAAGEILRELRLNDNVKSVEYTDRYEYLKVETKDGEFGVVMTAAENICRRVGGCDIIFSRFAWEDWGKAEA